MKNTEIEYWKCPDCKFKISDGEYQSETYGFTCPKCRKCNISDYTPRFKKRIKQEIQQWPKNK